MSLSTIAALKDTAILFAVNDTDAFTDSKADVDALPAYKKINLLASHIAISSVEYRGADNTVVEPENNPDTKALHKQEVGAVDEALVITMQLDLYSDPSRKTLAILRNMHRRKQLDFGKYPSGRMGFLCDIDYFTLYPNADRGYTMLTPHVMWRPGANYMDVTITLVLGTSILTESPLTAVPA